MHACIYACMYVNAISSGHDTPCSISELCWQKTSSPDAAPQLGTPHWGTRRNPLCVKHAITDNREGLGPYKIK